MKWLCFTTFESFKCFCLCWNFLPMLEIPRYYELCLALIWCTPCAIAPRDHCASVRCEPKTLQWPILGIPSPTHLLSHCQSISIKSPSQTTPKHITFPDHHINSLSFKLNPANEHPRPIHIQHHLTQRIKTMAQQKKKKNSVLYMFSDSLTYIMMSYLELYS